MTNQGKLQFDAELQPPKGFGGKTYIKTLDGKRLGRQMQAVYDFLDSEDGWYTLHELEIELEYQTGRIYPQASISARLRDLRKIGRRLDRRRRGEGKWGVHEYRLVPVAEQIAEIATQETPSND